MRFKKGPKRDSAYLALDERATVATSVVVIDEESGLPRNVTLHFDSPGRLIGVEFTEARRHVPARLLADGRGLCVTRDREVGAAYLHLQPIAAGGVAETQTFGAENDRPAWGINLDFDGDGRLVGIEFESDPLAPAHLLAAAVQP